MFGAWIQPSEGLCRAASAQCVSLTLCLLSRAHWSVWSQPGDVQKPSISLFCQWILPWDKAELQLCVVTGIGHIWTESKHSSGCFHRCSAWHALDVLRYARLKRQFSSSVLLSIVAAPSTATTTLSRVRQMSFQMRNCCLGLWEKCWGTTAEEAAGTEQSSTEWFRCLVNRKRLIPS